MELSYWTSRWKKGNTGFHQEAGYAGLRKHWQDLGLPEQPSALVPLCGKSTDLYWLAQRCSRVVGVEISEIAVRQFFTEHNLEAEISTYAGFTIYHSDNIELWCGDFLKLPENKRSGFSIIYDKAALVALPENKRAAYVKKLLRLCHTGTKILLHHFTYPQNEMNGPPFSLQRNELTALFGNNMDIRQLEKNELSINNYQKFVKRGLKSYLIEYLLLLSVMNGIK